MILMHVNTKMPIYRDCTLIEILCTGGGVFITLIILLPFLAYVLFGYSWIGLILLFLIFLPLTKILLSQLQRLKYGKPHGYYRHLFLKKCFLWGLIKNSPFLERQGKWSVRRESKLYDK